MKTMKGVISAVVFAMLMGVLAMQPAKAGNISWSIQLNIPGHNHGGGHLGTIGTPPTSHTHYPGCGHLHHDYHVQPPYNTGHYHLDHYHYYDGRYGYHHHQGHRYPVVHEFRNYNGELCKEFQMEVNINGRYQLAWGVACRDHRGYWRLMR